jgi:lysophospholipase L1-like esterase
LNPAQTRPSRPGRKIALRVGYFAAFSGLFGCHAERDQPASRSPEASLSAAPVALPAAAPLQPPEPPPSAALPAQSAAQLDASAAPLSASAVPSDAPMAEPPTAPATPANAPLGTRHHYAIAAVGDSLTDPRSHGGGYLDYVKQRCPNVEIDNFGRGGTMVNQMRRHFDEEVASSPKQYTHLIVFGGVNDLYSDLTALRTPAKIEADLSYMYSTAKARGMKVVAITVAPWGGFRRYFNPSRAEATHAVNAWLREQPSKGKVDRVVDAYRLLSCGDPDTLCDRFFKPFKDGIHFGPDGHRLLGEALYRAAFSDCQ